MLLAVTAAAHAAPLATLTVGRQATADRLMVEGRIEAVGSATVAAQVPGRILAVTVEVGQRVRRGDVLVRVDGREAAEALAAARAAATEAKARLDRTQQLQRSSFVSAAAVDQARAAYDTAQAQADAARAAVGHAVLSAPIDGVVAVRHVEPGELATPGRPLVTVIDPTRLRVTAHVPQGQLAALAAVRTAVVEIPEQGLRIDSAAVQVLPTVDAGTHVAEVRVGLPAGAGSLLPGMAARVGLPVGQAERLTVPRAAVLRRGELASVYIVAADGRLSLRQVRLGPTSGDGGGPDVAVEILAGLKAGDTIALDPVAAGIALQAQRAGKH